MDRGVRVHINILGLSGKFITFKIVSIYKLEAKRLHTSLSPKTLILFSFSLLFKNFV